ncbi:MAG TPA: hypothetical protein VLT86_16205 [Vicinamibacterales bacterium]|nr:hypothetical protein [Vicinamibacterales bacterium]
MTDTLFGHLFRALDLAIVERLSDGLFQLLTPAPVWLEQAFEAAPAGARASVDGAFPFLEDVVHQARAAWRPDGTPQSFGPFAAPVGDEELLLRATALNVEGRTLLVLERLQGVADARPMLQKARERMLEGEDLVRRVHALHPPAVAIDRTIASLRAAALPADQQALVTALYEANERLRDALGRLPAPPVRQRR